MRAVTAFTVIAERDDWIVVDKPAPLVVHPANGKDWEPSLLGGLQALLLYDLATGGSLSILTRLDRETSGLVLVAKRTAAARHFSLQLEQRRVEKEYLAIAHGWPAWDATLLNAPILRLGEISPGPIWLRQGVHPAGRECITAFWVERRFENASGRFSLIRCVPQTGRMHQLRVHLEHLGHPLVGDKLYGTDGSAYLRQFEGRLSDPSIASLLLPRHALHACALRTISPDGQPLSWTSPLPPDLARFCQSGGVGEGHAEPV